MNIWSLKKDPSIQRVLLLLVEQLGPDAFVINKETQTDFCSVIIHHPKDKGISAFLYTYGQDDDRYGVHLEYPPTSLNTNLYDAMENLTIKSLTEALAVHLEIHHIKPLPIQSE